MPSVTIHNAKQLDYVLEAKIRYVLSKTQDTINNVIQESINQYYKDKAFRNGTSCIPEQYKRTYKFLNSLVKTDIVKNGNYFECTVGIDRDYYENYKYPGNDGYDGNKPPTAKQVVNLANETPMNHGWYRTGQNDGFWDSAMEELGDYDGIINLMVENFKKVGLNVT